MPPPEPPSAEEVDRFVERLLHANERPPHIGPADLLNIVRAFMSDDAAERAAQTLLRTH
jgi:hypothetical protein